LVGVRDCPVCDEASPDHTPLCTCGYSFATRSPNLAIERFTREARHSNAVWRRGLIALVCLPITFSVGSVPTGMMLAMAQFGLAALWIVQGLVRGDVANRKLAAAKQLAQLPEARLIER
jgi:hypothetical protein